jgi:phage recombination protein Bet
MNVPALQPRQVTLVKQTIAKDCNNDEFDLFIEAARSYGLDPFRKQIIPLVFNKSNDKKRQMAIVVTRDGLRIMAQRCGNYRPATKPAEYVIDENLKSPINPLGIVCARVTLWQRDDRSGDWYEVAGEAYWDEFAATKQVWEGGRPTDKQDLDGNWKRMPRVMIAKCAEAQALRAGWPDQFSGVYVEEEMDRARVADQNASEIVAHEQEERRLMLTKSKDTIMIVWLAGMPMEPVPLGQVADRCIEWLRDGSRTLDQIEDFSSINSYSLREFWAKSPSDALEVKKVLEQRLSALQKDAA